MHAVLLASLVALSHWGLLGLSSADDVAQRCCDELDVLTKAFPDEDNECLVEDCASWLADFRAHVTSNDTSCPVSEDNVCEKFADLKYNSITTIPDTIWFASGHSVTGRNILRVVDTQNWQNCVIVYDYRAWSTLHFLTSSLSDRHIDFVIYDVMAVNETSELQAVLEEVLGELKMKNFIVISNLDFAYTLFSEVEQYDSRLGRTSAVRMFTRWIVTTSGGLEEQLAIAAAYLDNVVAVIESHEVFLTNTSVLFNNELQCIASDVSTLMYSSNNTRTFQSTTVLLSGGDLVVNDTFPNERHGFNTLTLAVGTKDWDPFVIKTRDRSGGLVYTGLCMDLLNELASVLNFTYQIVEPPANEGWGNQNASGYWEGLVGQVDRQEVDVVVAPMSISIERTLVMDATYPFMTNYLAAIYKKPDPALDKWRTYLRPFRGEVLLCLGITLVLVTCLVHVISWISPQKKTVSAEAEKDKHEDTHDKNSKKKQQRFPGPSPDDGFWYLYGALLSQGGMILPRSSSGRMLVAAWWLFSIVMGATYSGNLIAFLTVQLEIKPFNNLEQMLEQDTYTWGVAEKTVSHTILMESRNPILKEIGNKLMGFAASDPDVLSMDDDVQMAKAKAGEYVYITDSVGGEVWTKEHCDFDQIIAEDSAANPYVVALPRGSPYTRLFDEYVMRIVEAGLIKKWKQDWFADDILCVKSIVTDSPKISVLDVQSVLYVSVIGFGLALIALSLECLCHRHPKLRAWTDRMGDACVDGCEGQNGNEKDNEPGGSNGRDSRHLQHNGFGSNNNYERGIEGEDEERRGRDEESRRRDGETGEVGLHEVILMDELEEGMGDSHKFHNGGIFYIDGPSTDRRNSLMFDTVYSSPEDFGRDVREVVRQPGWDRRGSRIVRISDDVKVCT
ncbi:hypothetical protein V1264_018609 [Littorina saxatilis]|uniref:Uncharacterized protein n=1 Tax=Littorina saxatilis TaxID=31220 RepID=A0AAN9BES8_9CAEN